MAAQQISGYELFGGRVRSLNASLGINQSPTTVTVDIVKDDNPISVSNRQITDISIGAFDFRGIVQSWSQAKIDINGTGVYQVRLTDTKPVLNAAQVIIGSAFDSTKTTSYDYGDNVIPVTFESATQISNGVPFSTIQTVIENASIRYGSQTYTVEFNFTLPDRGSLVEYSISGRALSLLELISQIANDHGLNWYVSTSSDNVISVNMFGRSNLTNLTVNQLAALHPSAIVRRHEGLENRDAIQKVVLVGGYKTYLNKTNGSLWEQFWGFESDGNKRSEPVYSNDIMEQIINNDFTYEDYTEEDAQKIISYANEYWGRKFIGLITPASAVSSDGISWVSPVTSAWNNSDSFPLDFNRDGQLKFQTEDGRWITFVTLPLPGSRYDTSNTKVSYQWDDELFSNPNTHIDDDGNITVKASLEIIDGFSEIEYWLELFIVYLLNLETFTSISSALTGFLIENSDISTIVKLNLIRLVGEISSDLTDIANGNLIYTDAVKNTFSKSFGDQYFLLTLATPLRVKSITKDSAVNEDTGFVEQSDVITRTRVESIEEAYLALSDQRETYGPWSNRENAIGRTEVIIDPSLTPWSFGYRGITNATGTDLMDQVARAKIRTVADITLDAKTAELEVAGLPAINLGSQIQTTGAVTSISITFSVQGVKTIYKALQYTNDLSKYIRQQQELIDKLRRQAAEFNNTQLPPQNDWKLDRTLRNLKKELPDPSVGSKNEGNRRSARRLLGRIDERASDTEPKYHILPMAWVSDAFGELTLVRDPKVFGRYLNVVNMSEKQTAPGRLPVGTDVQVNEFLTTDGGVTAYYIEVSAPKPPTFKATIIDFVSDSSPIYEVEPVVNGVQEINLLSTELLALQAVTNIGEPENYRGYLSIGAEVTISWNENSDGTYTPFIEQQVNLFKPV